MNDVRKNTMVQLNEELLSFADFFISLLRQQSKLFWTATFAKR